MHDRRGARTEQIAAALRDGFTDDELAQLHGGRAAARAAGGEALMGLAPTPRPGRRPKPPKPDRYAWVALANTTAAIFMAALDGSIVIIALPAIFRGINLDPLSAGQHQLPAVDDHGLPPGAGGTRGQPRPAGRHVRPGQDVQRGLRGVHRRVGPAVVRPVPGHARGDVADRLAVPAGHRRVDADGQLGGDPHRRVPAGAARLRARHQPDRGAGGHVHRPGRGRPARRLGLARRVLDQRPGRRVRHAVGLPAAARQRRAAPRPRSTGGATSPSPSASARSSSASPTASSPTRHTRWAGRTPVVLGELIGGTRRC